MFHKINMVLIFYFTVFFFTVQYHAESIANVRAAVNNFSVPRVVGIALDTKGPEIRTGVFAAVKK